MTRAHLVLVCLLSASLLPAVARADDAKAAAVHFREGQRAFDAHDYARAGSEFEAANAAKPAAAALLGAGLAWERGGDALRAANDLAAALAAGGLEARDETTARTHLADLDTKLGHLDVSGPASQHLSIDAQDRGPLPLEVRVTPGDHALEMVTAGGTAVRRVVTVAPGATMRIDMTTTEAPPPPPPPPPHAPIQATLGWISVGVGASALVAGVIVGALGLSSRDDFVNGGSVSTSLHDDAITMRTWANVLFVSAGVFVAAGAALVFTAPRAHALAIGVGPSSANLRVSF